MSRIARLGRIKERSEDDPACADIVLPGVDARRDFLDLDVAATAPTGALTRTQELRPPPGWGNAECGFYMLRHAPMLTGA